jgi:hypothetical protein
MLHIRFMVLILCAVGVTGEPRRVACDISCRFRVIVNSPCTLRIHTSGRLVLIGCKAQYPTAALFHTSQVFLVRPPLFSSPLVMCVSPACLVCISVFLLHVRVCIQQWPKSRSEALCLLSHFGVEASVRLGSTPSYSWGSRLRSRPENQKSGMRSCPFLAYFPYFEKK